MSYKALYRKYRPTTFKEVKGQDHVIRTLENVLKTKKISHAYIFSGPRGVGKTSIAKIFANVLNCLHNEDPTQACANCYANLNNNLDVIEMDAASNNGVDQIRDLKEKIEHTPSLGQYKIYIIDEVHMLSKSAFNALLKTLEEPPAHAIFILATTDPQKIPATIVSRTQRFNFRRIPNPVIIQQVKAILDHENIKIEPSALPLIANLANGGLRDALSIADQCAAYGDNIIRTQDVLSTFGIVSNELLIKTLSMIYSNEVKPLMNLFKKLKDSGMEATNYIKGLINVAQDYLIYNKTKDENLLETLTLDEVKTIKLSQEFILRFIPFAQELFQKITYSEIPFEIAEYGILEALKIQSQIRSENNYAPIVDSNAQNNQFDLELIKGLITQEVEKYQKTQKELNKLHFSNQDSSLNNGIDFSKKEVQTQTTEIEQNNNVYQDDEYFGFSPDDKMTQIYSDPFLESKKNIEDQLNQSSLFNSKDDNSTQLINQSDELINQFVETINNHKDLVNDVETTSEFEKPAYIDTREISLMNSLSNQTKEHTLELTIEEPKTDLVEMSEFDNWVNAALQIDSQISNRYRQILKMPLFDINLTNKKYIEQYKIFDSGDVSIPGAGENFIILRVDDVIKRDKLIKNKDTLWLQDYLKDVFGKFMHVYVLSTPDVVLLRETVKEIKQNKREWNKNKKITPYSLPNQKEQEMQKIFGFKPKIKQK
ncbi:DNA polymerase III subunit gamma/tau [Mycoplasmopsis pullorum]|uniref:DNA polymerase III subunit gamma/tau n=1 Tax=Mycoplasmopsis pullorum TaxID=48003 RepID=UPI001118E5ED|nr:DNA polymerase III subunit gamma/tau [Mycoplasmopsis pullorum]TNK83254.1 DNA polymerase III subunit gamma/tau [Mycoplasmopsis pullorum]